MTGQPFAITLEVGTSLANHTGSWRTLRPEYVSLIRVKGQTPVQQQLKVVWDTGDDNEQ